MADGGYTPAAIDRFTLADVNLIYSHWAANPPLRVMVAGYLGVKPKAKAEPPPAMASIASLRAQFPDGFMRI